MTTPNDAPRPTSELVKRVKNVKLSTPTLAPMDDRAKLSLIHHDLLDAIAASLQSLEARIKELVGALKSVLAYVGRKCPCENEQPNPCPLCGASVENLEGCKAIDKLLPPKLLAQIRGAIGDA